jgi:hypothetical protein
MPFLSSISPGRTRIFKQRREVQECRKPCDGDDMVKRASDGEVGNNARIPRWRGAGSDTVMPASTQRRDSHRVGETRDSHALPKAKPWRGPSYNIVWAAMGVGGVSRSRDLGGDWIRAQCKALFRLVPAPSEQVDQPEPSGSEAGISPRNGSELPENGSHVREKASRSNEPSDSPE